jgi:phosphoglycolate phosphatase-like HAD superfamily hydrolase
VIVDARDLASAFAGVSLKLNAAEAAKLAADANAAADLAALAGELHKRQGRPGFVTRGERGLLGAAAGAVAEVPGIQVAPPIDPVGAGDTVLATLAAALAVDAAPDAPLAAAQLANIAAAVTLRKIGMTGTATPAEILAAAERAEYVHRPDLAEAPRRAVFLPDSEIEIVEAPPARLAISHAIFDHDGTLSTLREGWEKIMEPMMVKAILGPRHKTADDALFERVTRASREFIDRTTGIQTLVQMHGLVDLVRSFGCVPENEILDAAGYKRIYNEALLEMVRERVRKLERGELAPEDFHVKNAHALLRALHERGVALYLASGTDVEDVIAEARAMGYADLFGDRIFGAVGDVNVEAKKEVLTRIMRENALTGAHFVTFGDGPVEIRETRRRGGVAVGVASDEVRRYGLNLSKRRRLIRAGASLIVPDFSQLPALLEALHLGASGQRAASTPRKARS